MERFATVARGLVFAGLAAAFFAPTAGAAIIGVLELPDGFASGASNVQGWAYTTTPGAKLTPPFAVLIDGVEEFKVPCCGSRGDVQAAHPEAPVLTGFATVYNWGLAATPSMEASQPQVIPVATREILVQVVVTDDMGGVKILGKTVDLYHPTAWPFNKLMQWDSEPPLLPVGVDASAGFIENITSECLLSNLGFYTFDAAQLSCTNVVFTAPDDTKAICAEVVFSWDRGSQSFKLTSDCLPGMLK